MAEVYTIELEDAVSANAYRVAKGYVDVSVAAQELAAAVRTWDKEAIKDARIWMQYNQVQLRAAKAAQTAANAVAKLGPKVSNAVPPVQRFTSATSRATAQSTRFSYSLNALAQSATSLAFSLAGRLAQSAIDAGQSLLETADLATRAHLSFANFFGGQASGDKMLQESIEIAKRYGFTIADTVAQIQRFGAAGFDTEQSKGLLRFGADMMAAGRSVQDVKGIFLAMTQIQGKGKLQAEELTQQLAERGINAGRVWEIMAKNLGKTKEEVMAMQKKGLLKPGLALNAIVQAGVEGVHGAAIGKAGEQVADATVGGLGRRMSTEIESSVFNAVDKANPKLVSGMQAIFKGMTGSDTNGLEVNITKALEGIGTFLEKVGPQLPAVADNFAKAFNSAAGFDAKTFDHFAEALPGVAKDLGTIAGLLTQIVSLMAKIGTFTLNPQAGVARAFGLEGMGKQVQEGTSPGQRMTKWLEDAGERMFGKSKEAGAMVSEGLATGIESSAPSAGAAAGDAAQGAINASKETLDCHSPSRKFKKQGQMIAEGLALGIESNADLVSGPTERLANNSIAASAGAMGVDGARAIAAGTSAGEAVGGRSAALSVRIGDIILGGGASSSGGSDAETLREYLETEFVAMLERHLEGVGA